MDMESASAPLTSIRLDDEVIPTNGAVVMAAQEQPEFADRISVCSCSCYNLRSGKFRRKPRGLFKSLKFSRKSRSVVNTAGGGEGGGRTGGGGGGGGGGGASEGGFAKQHYETEERDMGQEAEGSSVAWKELCSLKRASI